MTRLEHLASVVRQAAANGGPGPLSTGEALAAALVLNRHEWLSQLGYTIAQALDRIDDDWIAMIPQVARMVAAADAVMDEARTSARQEAELKGLASGTEEVDVAAKLVTYGNAPGYRAVSLTFDVKRTGDTTEQTRRLCLRINTEDGESIARHILGVHRIAWEGDGPIDAKPDERRPRWIDGQQGSSEENDVGKLKTWQ